ncbi:MAG: DUF4340 domain-containing protein [bacterium]
MEPQKSLTEDWFLWFLLVLATGVVGGYYYFAFVQDTEKETGQWLFEGEDPASVRTLKRYDGETLGFSITQGPSQSWTINRPRGIHLDQSAVNNWLETLLSLDIKRRFSAQPGADYGIHSGSTRIQVIQEGKRRTLYIGGKNPTGTGFYVRYGDSKSAPVFLLPNRIREDFLPGLFELRDKRLMSGKLKNLRSVSFQTSGDSITFRRSGKRWMIASGRRTTLDETSTRNLREDIRSLLSLKASTFYDTRSGLKTVQGAIELHYGDTTSRVSIGQKMNGERSLTVEGRPVVGVTQDPVKQFEDLPVKPDGWPVVKKAEPRPQFDTAPSGPNQPTTGTVDVFEDTFLKKPNEEQNASTPSRSVRENDRTSDTEAGF